MDSNLQQIEEWSSMDQKDGHKFYLVSGEQRVEVGWEWMIKKGWIMIKDDSRFSKGYRYRGYIIIKYSRYNTEFKQNEEGTINHIFYIEDRECRQKI